LVLPACLLFAVTAACAGTPYRLMGLDADLTLGDAVAKAEAMGATCKLLPPDAVQAYTRGHCEFLPCLDRTAHGQCNAWDLEQPGPRLAGQQLLWLRFDAPGEDALLVKLTFIFEGDAEVVAEYLIARFGPTDFDTYDPDKQRWSHARRRTWVAEPYRAGIAQDHRTVTLSANR